MRLFDTAGLCRRRRRIPERTICESMRSIGLTRAKLSYLISSQTGS